VVSLRVFIFRNPSGGPQFLMVNGKYLFRLLIVTRLGWIPVPVGGKTVAYGFENGHLHGEACSP
jgi:hypothetical protein